MGIELVVAFALVLSAMMKLGDRFFFFADGTNACGFHLELGMTVKEVENMLGEPGSRHVDIWRDLAKEPGNWFAEPNPHILDDRNLTWIGRNGFIHIRYDERRHVIGKYFSEFLSTRPSLIDRLRDWLGW